MLLPSSGLKVQGQRRSQIQNVSTKCQNSTSSKPKILCLHNTHHNNLRTYIKQYGCQTSTLSPAWKSMLLAMDTRDIGPNTCVALSSKRGRPLISQFIEQNRNSSIPRNENYMLTLYPGYIEKSWGQEQQTYAMCAFVVHNISLEPSIHWYHNFSYY